MTMSGLDYVALNAVFLAAVAAVAIIAAVRRGRGWRAVLITTAVLVVVSIVFDNVMISVGLVGYDRARISGVFIGVAPVEDFAYAIAAAVLLPALWMLLSPREKREKR